LAFSRCMVHALHRKHADKCVNVFMVCTKTSNGSNPINVPSPQARTMQRQQTAIRNHGQQAMCNTC